MPPLCSRAIDLLKAFRAKGGWVALDDFGSGFAHWELLQAGLVDTIKVANQNLNNKDQSHNFVNGLSKFAESMQINTVLEGVETKEDFERGISQGFRNFQGWYFN
jgi:EAL domain-containing protein (putative c-di-GMP-specific phosphodiesterase class I)